MQKIWSTDLLVFGMLSTIILLWALAETPTLKKGLVTGVSIGLVSLVDPIIFAFLPWAIIWLWFNAQAPWQTRLTTIATVLVLLATTIAPWLVRNYIVFDQFAFIKSNFGRELWVGNNKNATGWHHETADAFALLSPEERHHLDQLNEAQRHHYFHQKGVEFIKHHPGQFVRLSAIRFVGYWTNRKMKRSLGARIASAAYLVLLAVGMIGLYLAHRQGREVQLPILVFLSLPIPYYITAFKLLHYRFPVEVILTVFAGYALYRVHDRFSA